MGGVLIDENTRALRADGSVVPSLYCAGEITGVIHGGNRLGGNAIVDFTVFGRLAGIAAAAGR
jgi:succinate dehydrogenase/fumarate reductase flavoprotein subunit